MDYVPAKAPVLMGHHFSSIAGAGPINGPIQAAVFGWLPCMLWILIGGIFFGAVHDYGALFASIRHKGQTLGEVVAANIGERAKKLFIIFSYLTLVLVVAAFASIVAGTFNGFTAEGAHNDANVLCMGERVVGAGLACQLADLFLDTPFEGGRHARRVEQIAALERECFTDPWSENLLEDALFE